MNRKPLVVGGLVSLGCLVGFWELAEDFAYSPVIVRLDALASAVVHSLRDPYLTQVMKAITATGGTLFVTVVTLVLAIVLWVRGRRADAGFIAAAVAGGAILSTLAKGNFGRMRPPADAALISLPESFSFPSGHSMASLCLGTALAYLALRSEMRPGTKVLAVTACALYALAVGVSRVYLGVHWPSDVLASWLLGGAWLALVIGVAESLR